MNKKFFLRNTLKFILLIIFITGSFAGHAGNDKKLKKTNFSEMYSEHQFTDFDAVIYHTSSDSSTVYVNVHLSDFLYVQNASDKVNMARFKINYELFGSFDTKETPDSASFFYKDTQNFRAETDMITTFAVPAKFPGDLDTEDHPYRPQQDEKQPGDPVFQHIKNR